MKNSNPNIFCSSWSSSILLTLLIISSKSSIFSLKVSDSSLIVSLTSGKIDWSCSDKFLSSIFGTGLLGVIAIVLFFSSVIWVIGLAKLSIVGFEGSGAIFRSLFLKGDKLSGWFPSENKNLFLVVQSVQGNAETVEGNVKNPLQHLVESNVKNLLKEYTAVYLKN